LFAPIKIRELELKNRIVVSPMCTYSSNDGFLSKWHLVHYGSCSTIPSAMCLFFFATLGAL
jgi:2,4-dienoyl-CoA reductase-like NADH-dependent reductase (Old Yellow Enzyme family)